MSLHLTPTRLALLRAVQADRVHHQLLFGANGKPDTRVSVERCVGGVELLRTAQMDLLEGADLVAKGPRTGPSMYARRPWLLTDAGKAELERAKR